MQPERWRRVETLFVQLTTVPPEGRPALLDVECAGDPALRQEIETLLSAHLGAPGPLDTPPTWNDEPEPREPRAQGDQARPAAPSRVGPYQLLRPIAEGGMGTVWLAERADGLVKRKVALKLPRWSWARPDLPARMARERDILAALEHPNIARLYD